MKRIIIILATLLTSCSAKIITDASVQARLQKITWISKSQCTLYFKDKKDSTHTVFYKTPALRTHTFIIGHWYTIKYQSHANRTDSCKPVFATIKHNQ